jgi:hypothetical protein
MTAASKKLSGVDIQRQLRHKNETKMEHNVKLDDRVKGLGNESNTANVIEKIPGHPSSESVDIRQKNDLAS